MPLLILGMFTTACFSQEPDDKIDQRNVNLPYLEFLVKTKIDSIRNNNGHFPLVNDAILYEAAKHHADYLVKEDLISHTEPNKKFANPQKRVEHFGGLDYFAGENVASIYILVPTRSKRIRKVHINETYEDAANELVVAWVKSKPHYKNMNLDKYQVTGLALSFDRAKNCIKAVQVFAEVKSKFVFTEDTTKFIYEEPYTIDYKLERMDQVSRRPHKGRHEWNLRIPKRNYKRKTEVRPIYVNKDDLQFYIDSNGYVHSYTENTGLIKCITRRWRDGFALESVEYTDYECGNKQYFLKPSRRNGECIANGKVQKPLYKWKMKKVWRQNHRRFRRDKIKKTIKLITSFQFKKKYPKIPETLFKKYGGCPLDWKLGKLPKNDSTYYEMDVLILRHKRVCGVIHFTDFCGGPFEQIVPLGMLADLSDKSFIFPEDTLDYSFTVPFDKNRSEYKLEDIESLLDSLSLKDKRIVKIKVSAFASVEGSFEKNKVLADKRSQSILRVLASLQKDSVSQVVEVEEDWKQFY